MLAANSEAFPDSEKNVLPAQADTRRPGTLSDLMTKDVLSFVQGSTGAPIIYR